MDDNRREFRDRLLNVEPVSPDLKQQYQKEIRAMFIQELTTPRRMLFGIVAVAALVSSGVCGFLAVTEPDLPTAARIGLGVGTLFGLAWAGTAIAILKKGALDLNTHGRRIAVMVWTFTVLMMVFFLYLGMTTEDRMLGLMMMVYGLAFLVGAAVFWLSFLINEAKLATREKLLELELRLSELAEKA